MIENRTSLKKPNIVGGKGGDNGKQTETRRTNQEHKIFLNCDGGTSKEREDKKGKVTNPKKTKTRNRNGSQEICTPKKERGKESKQTKERNRNVHRTQRRISRFAKPPLCLPRGAESGMMLAHRRRPWTGRENRRRICGGGKHRTGCA
jgi:hypothetical protein